jgi:heme-degrading monooxygenase HmoA
MLARITRFQTSLEIIDESIKNFKDNVIPAVSLQKGYRSGYLLVDRKAGKFITIAFWDSEEDVIADENSGYYQKRVDTGKNHFVAPPVRELYEVVL